MSNRIEWVDATQVLYVTDDVVDDHGTRLDPGRFGLCLGDGVVVEGTPEELIAWSDRVRAAVVEKCGRREDEIVYRRTVGDLEAQAGRTLTDDQVQRIAGAIDHSTIPDALATIIDAVAPAPVCRTCGDTPGDVAAPLCQGNQPHDFAQGDDD
jgi:hypothetical protein